MTDNLGYTPQLINIDPLYNTRFTLQNAIGKCAKSLKGNHPSSADTSLYKSCFCCGDIYNAGSSLGCPKSPWA